MGLNVLLLRSLNPNFGKREINSEIAISHTFTASIFRSWSNVMFLEPFASSFYYHRCKRAMPFVQKVSKSEKQ